MINGNEIQQPDVAMDPQAPPLKKLDLACGDAKAEGFIGVDIAQTPAVDVLHDLRQAPWPFEDNSIDEARCSHFFEHLEPTERILFMNELWRVLKPGAGCVFTTPRGLNRQMQDFSHKWPPIVEASYYYFSKEWYKANRLEHYITLHNINCDFEVRPSNVSIEGEFAARSDEHKMFAIRNYTNAAVDLTVVMVKKA